MVIVVLLLVARFGVKAVVPGFRGFALGMQWALGAAVAVVLWWTFFSRARWLDRVGAIVVMIVGLAATWFLRHESMGPAWFFGYAVPTVCLALVAGAVASRRLSDGPRRATMAATILLACGVWMLVRTEGISGDHALKFDWRWTKSPEERLLAQAPAAAEVPKTAAAAKADDKSIDSAPNTPLDSARGKPVALPNVATAKTEPAALAAVVARAEWPGFRGPERDGISRGVRIETNWSASPPVELWRRPIGPGWSSFAVRGDFLYTQEQRGDDEVVACYDATTGKPVWTHRDAARFFESNGGAGPRGTPTLSGDRVYAFGATGIVNALDAGNGAVVWSRNAASDTGAEVPTWGFSSSPLVVDDIVVVAASGRLVAYDLATGKPRWFAQDRRRELQLAASDDDRRRHAGPDVERRRRDQRRARRRQAALGALVAGRTDRAAGSDRGRRRPDHRWRGDSGTRRIAVAHGPGGWTVAERWTSRGLKPYFNDFVVHKGHAFGFDASILACIDLEDGTRKWKGGRYGNGQLVLLPDQDLLLVLSEEGELALVRATPDQFTELARFPAIEGKTWNHPVLVGDVLLVRNGEEMAAFRLPLAGR